MVSRTTVVATCLALSWPVLADEAVSATVLGLAPGSTIRELEERLDLEPGDRLDALVSRRLPESLPKAARYELVFDGTGLAAVKAYTPPREAPGGALAEDFAGLRAWLEDRYGPPDVEKQGALPLAGWNEGLPDVLDRVGLMVRPGADGYRVVAAFLFAGFDPARRPPRTHPIDPDGFRGSRRGGGGHHHVPWGATVDTFYDAVHLAGRPSCAPIGEQAVTCASVSIDGGLEARVSAYFDAAGRLVHLEERYAGAELYAEYQWASQFLRFNRRYTPGFPLKDETEDAWAWEEDHTRMLMRDVTCRGDAEQRRCGFELDYRPSSAARVAPSTSQ